MIGTAVAASGEGGASFGEAAAGDLLRLGGEAPFLGGFDEAELTGHVDILRRGSDIEAIGVPRMVTSWFVTSIVQVFDPVANRGSSASRRTGHFAGSGAGVTGATGESNPT